MNLIRRYICLEILVPFFLALAVLVFVLLLGNLYKMAEMVVAEGVRLVDVAGLILAMIPYLLTMAIPMSFFFALMVGLGRMGSDGEMTALKALGISPFHLLPPVLTLAVLSTCCVLVLEVWLAPLGMKQMQTIALDILKNKTVLALRPRALSMELQGLAIYVNDVDRESGTMSRVVIFDQRNTGQEYTVTARDGMVIPDQETGNLVFLLRQGTIHGLGKDGSSYQLTDFKEYTLNLEMDALLGKGGVARRQRNNSLTVPELRRRIARLEKGGKDAGGVRNHLHKRFAQPFSCIVFALLGIPLALEPVRTSGRFRGFVFALILLLAYYVLFSFGQAIGERGGPLQLPALWFANVVFAVLGGFLFWKKQQERELPLVQAANNLYRRLVLIWKAE
ncbi:MAG: LPS export ABC transporter permease LptF [Deltaproteobacteria bacterium]|nr:LPS export ABC transporter permease LptF [Candidatus Anaeroferrophillus wilburensis]MBN2889248.1 LPS export ABC transporter permease LptF [Deltaproteobacteria bacterium]